MKYFSGILPPGVVIRYDDKGDCFLKVAMKDKNGRVFTK
jgi:hypothetical protein